ncbi:MAG: DUF192 domain-containing protein, partial [Spirochaetia bacterium]
MSNSRPASSVGREKRGVSRHGTQRRRPVTTLVLGYAAFVLGACSANASELPTAQIRLGGHDMTVEVAATPESRREGLMNRDSLEEDRGMLFVFENADYRSFWMKDTSIP